MFRSIITLLATLLLGTAAFAQDKTAEIDKIFSWATPATPGCSVAVSLHGKVVVNRAYGSADLERDVPITPTTIFDAGSLTKQFVSATVLLLVEEGRLSLSDDVRKYIPELPDYGKKITLDHLLTHTSGIRDWTGMLPLTDGKTDALTLILRQRGLNFAPGEEWSYSNSGYVLLKEVVARTSGMPFADFARKRLFEPLGMKSTSYVTDMREIVKNRALAYEKEDGRWKMAMLLDNDRGGGGLLSTAGDLLIWNDALTNARLGAFVSAKMQEPATLNNGRKIGYARGLYVDSARGSKMVGHTGSAAGYKSFLARFPEQGLSTAIMCNSGEGTDRMSFAHRIFDLYAPNAADPKGDAEAPAAMAGVDVSGKAGLFFNERTGEPLRLGVNDGKLRIAGGPPLVLVAADRFRNPRPSLELLSGDEFELHFLSQDQFEVKSMEGQITRYRRAQRYAPTADDLSKFAGRYESDEIGAVFQIVPGKDGIVMRFDRSPEKAVEMKPTDRDTFQRGMMMVRFRRDERGNVVAFDYSNPLLRNVKFTRR